MHELQLVELVVIQRTAVDVVKAFQCQEKQLSPSQEQAAKIEFHGGCHNLLDSMNCLTPFFQLHKAQLTHIHSPSSTKQQWWAHADC